MTTSRAIESLFVMSTLLRQSHAAWGLLTWTLVISVVADARDLHVDPQLGNDAADGVAQPVRTIGRAIRLAQAGDSIHLQPRVYRDTAAFYDKAGEPGKPITLEGHGATLDGCDPLDPTGWIEVEPGLYRHDNLLPLTQAMVDRWFFFWDGRMNRMGRCSKGPSEPLKVPADLQSGGWTFVNDSQREARKGYIHGAFYLRLPAGQALSEAQIGVPLRMAGVSMHGKCAHLVIRHVTSTHPYNDGFNLSDCEDVRFENIRAIDCGDDGISAHGRCRYRVDGFLSQGNATGICDTGDSETDYRHVQIRDCIGFDLFFLDIGRYSLTNAWIQSSAARSLYLQGREDPATPCRVTLDNVHLERVKGANEVRVSANCQLIARQTTFLNLDVQATGGKIEVEQCWIGGNVAATPPRKPQLHLWKDAVWKGNGNWYDFGAARVGPENFTPQMLEGFRQSVLSDVGSRWEDVSADEVSRAGIGAGRNWLP